MRGYRDEDISREHDDSGDDPECIGVGKCLSQTEKAVRIHLDDENTPRWIPKSVLHDDSEVYQTGDTGKVIVKQWWAEKNGFYGF